MLPAVIGALSHVGGDAAQIQLSKPPPHSTLEPSARWVGGWYQGPASCGKNTKTDAPKVGGGQWASTHLVAIITAYR